MTKQTNRKQSRASVEVVVPYKGFVKVERDFLDHPMFRGHMDWLGAWILVLAAADYRDKRVNLTNVGRKAASDFNWDNAKWRRFTKRLEKEGLLATVEKRNLGDKLGYKHIALVLDKTSHSAESRIDEANIGSKTVRDSVGDGKHDGRARSDARSDGVSDNGADDGVLKNTEQRLKERKGPELIDSRTAPPSKSRKGKNNDGQEGDPSSNKEPAVSEPHPNQVANLSPEANKVRNLVAELVRGNFVEHLEKKISEGRLRADLFQFWHEKFNHAEIEEIWELATRRVPISSMDPYSVRKAFVGLLNYDTSYVDDHELRGWIRVQKDAENRKLRDTPTTYTRVGAQRLYAETVYEAADETIYASTVLPEKIDCFDIVTLQALNSWMEIDEERKERNKRAEDLLPDVDSRNIYFLINVALNPDQGVVFEPGYFANSQYFQGDETALFTTLQMLEDLRLVDIAKMDLESIETRPTPIERWHRSGATG